MKLILAIPLILFSSVNCYKLKMLKYEKCDPDAEYTVDIDTKLREEDDRQYIDTAMMKSPFPLGRNIDLVVENVLETEHFKHVVTIRKDFCDAIYEYTSEIVYELEDLSGIERGACPIPLGEYHVENYLLDFNKVKPYQELVEQGHLRSIANLFDPAMNASLACFDVEVLKIKEE